MKHLHVPKFYREVDMKTNIKENARKLKNDVPAVFLAMKDQKTPCNTSSCFSCLDNKAYSASGVGAVP